jgi:hypothetical protein
VKADAGAVGDGSLIEPSPKEHLGGGFPDEPVVGGVLVTLIHGAGEHDGQFVDGHFLVHVLESLLPQLEGLTGVPDHVVSPLWGDLLQWVVRCLACKGETCAERSMSQVPRLRLRNSSSYAHEHS